MWNEYRRNKFIKNLKNNFLYSMVGILFIAIIGAMCVFILWLFINSYIVFGVLATTFLVFIISATLAYFE